MKCIKVEIGTKKYSVFFKEDGSISQIHSTGGKSLAYVDIKGKTGAKVIKAALAAK